MNEKRIAYYSEKQREVIRKHGNSIGIFLLEDGAEVLVTETKDNGSKSHWDDAIYLGIVTKKVRDVDA